MHRISTSSVQTGKGSFVQFLGSHPTGSPTPVVALYILKSDIHQPPSRAVPFLKLQNEGGNTDSYPSTNR